MNVSANTSHRTVGGWWLLACVLPGLVLSNVNSSAAGAADAAPPDGLNRAARQYLDLIDNFAGFAEEHWNEAEQSYDAQGSGVQALPGHAATAASPWSTPRY